MNPQSLRISTEGYRRLKFCFAGIFPRSDPGEPGIA
jgi:hypothetical protein